MSIKKNDLYIVKELKKYNIICMVKNENKKMRGAYEVTFIIIVSNNNFVMWFARQDHENDGL